MMNLWWWWFWWLRWTYDDDEVEDDKDDGNDADHVESVRDLRHTVKVKAARIAGHPSRALAQKSLVKIDDFDYDDDDDGNNDYDDSNDYNGNSDSDGSNDYLHFALLVVGKEKPGPGVRRTVTPWGQNVIIVVVAVIINQPHRTVAIFIT